MVYELSWVEWFLYLVLLKCDMLGKNIMVKLSAYENRILDGEAGRLKQVAMQNIVRYAEILGAQSLCEVTKATVFCGAHHYLDVCKSEDFDVVFSRMNMASEDVLTFDTTDDNCYIQSCVSPCDQNAYKPFGQQGL